MHTGRNWGIARHSLAALTVTSALGGISVAGANAVSAPASGTPIPSAGQIVDARHNVWTLGGGVVYKRGNTAGYSANVSPLLFSAGNVHQRNKGCKWCAWSGSAFGATSNLARGGGPARPTGPAMTASTSFASIAAPTDASGILVADIAFVSTKNVSPVRIVGSSISALETAMKWRSSSFSIAGSRVWSKLIKFSSNGIYVRLPLN
jgi:hypothetical protein